MESFFHTVFGWIALIFALLIGLIALILVLIVVFQIGKFIYGVSRSLMLRMTVGARQRHFILKSLFDSEKDYYPHAYSLYEHHIHLAAGVKNIDAHKMRLDKYNQRIITQLEKTTISPDLEVSKVAYLEKNSEAIAKATARAKARGYDSFDIASPVFIFGDLDFGLPDFDFPDFGGFDINF